MTFSETISIITIIIFTLGIFFLNYFILRGRNKFWKQFAEHYGMSYESKWLTFILKNDHWEIKAFTTRYHYTVRFIANANKEPFMAKRKFGMTKWARHEHIDTNAENRQIIQILLKHQELIKKKFLRITCDGATITYKTTISKHAPRETANQLFEDIKALHQDLNS